jgi:hypothetical protein
MRALASPRFQWDSSVAPPMRTEPVSNRVPGANARTKLSSIAGRLLK